MHENNEVIVEINSEKDVLLAESYAKEIDEIVYIIVSELARNVIKHSFDGTGTLKISKNGESVNISLINKGEIRAKNFIDNYSTYSASFGVGLGAVGRLSDSLKFVSKDNTVKIEAIKYLKKEISKKLETACLCYSHVGLEDFNGDTYIKIDKINTTMLGVIDALGHGKSAHESAKAAKKFIENHHFLNLDDLIIELHDHLKEQHLRGCMVSLAKIYLDTNKLEYCGIGDSSIRIFADNDISLVNNDGVVGEILRKRIKVWEIDLPKNFILALYTDGVSTRITIPPELRSKDLVSLTFQLMEQYKRNDDRTLLLVRLIK